ncbi:MAG: hypothetical protein M3Y54_14765 [Bacteroidota bacterium]|nr:hypothetical protein [Bacteroidota bacterium]
MDNSIFKTGSKYGLGVALAAALLWWSLPVVIKRHTDVTRGEQLIGRLNTYYQAKSILPADTDWITLEHLGFSQNEIEHAYPQYVKLSNSDYALVFVSDFDGPYLTWKSTKRKWEITSGYYPLQFQKN